MEPTSTEPAEIPPASIPEPVVKVPAKEYEFHFVSKHRVLKTASGKLVEESDEPCTVLAPREGLKFTPLQLAGLEDVSAHFTKINYVAE